MSDLKHFTAPALTILAIATAALVWLQLQPAAGSTFAAKLLTAANGDLFGDADGDMIPDCLEIVAHTDPNSADTDQDGIDDFEEILTFTNNWPGAVAAPVNYGMRAMVTSSPRAGGGSDVHLHLLLRFVNLKPSEFVFKDIYANIDGHHVDLTDLLGQFDTKIQSRIRPRDGISYFVSLRITSVETLGVRAVMDNDAINAGTLVMNTGSGLGALLPLEGPSLTVQPIDTSAYLQEASPNYGGGGKVCEMGLTRIGSSPGGILCQIDTADCRPASGLRCSITCPSQVGEVIVIPGGLGTITGK